MRFCFSVKCVTFAVGFSGMLLAEASADDSSDKANEALIEKFSQPLKGFSGCVQAFAFSPDGKHLVGVGGSAPHPNRRKPVSRESVFWRTDNWEFVRMVKPIPNRFPDPSGRGLHAAYFRDGHWAIVVTDDHQLQWFQHERKAREGRSDWEMIQTLWLRQVYVGNARARSVNYPGFAPLRISPDENLLAVPIRGAIALKRPSDAMSEPGLVQIWKLASSARTEKTPPTLSQHLTLKHPDVLSLCDLAFTSDGKRLITTTADAKIHFWNPESGELLRELAFDDELLQSLRVAEYFTDPRPLSRECYLSLSPDGKTLALACQRVIRLYDLEKNQWLAHQQSPIREAVTAILFHPSGDWLLAIFSREMRIWSAPSLKPHGVFPLPENTVPHPPQFAFSPDGNLLVTGGYSPRRWSFGAMLRYAKTLPEDPNIP